MSRPGVLFFHDHKLDTKPASEYIVFGRGHVQLKMREIYFMFLYYVNQLLNLLPMKKSNLKIFEEHITFKVHTSKALVK